MDRHFSHMLIGHLLQSKDDLKRIEPIRTEIFSLLLHVDGCTRLTGNEFFHDFLRGHYKKITIF